MDLLVSILIILGCLALSAFFSGSETALLRVRREQVKRDIEDDDQGPGVVAARDLLKSPSRLLVTILLGNNVVNILAATVSSAVAVSLLGAGTGIAVATAVLTVVIFLFCEVLPKAVAVRNPKRLAYIASLPLYLIHQLLRPVHLFYDRAIDPLVHRVAGKDDVDESLVTEELLQMAREAQEEGGDAPTINIIGATASAVNTTAGDIMVPRTEVIAFDADDDPAAVLESLLTDGYTRAPAYEGDIDHVIGVVHLKDLVRLNASTPQDSGVGACGELRRIVKPVLKVPLRKPILELLTDTQRAFVHFVIVQDEFGVTQGIVTQEDILEELVGEIRDEFDRDELESIREVAAGRWQALGRVKVHDFNRATGQNLEAETGDTLAGVVFNTIGRAPRRGESVRLDGYEIVVSELSRNRVTQVEVFDRS